MNIGQGAAIRHPISWMVKMPPAIHSTCAFETRFRRLGLPDKDGATIWIRSSS